MGADAPPAPNNYQQTSDTLKAQVDLAPQKYASEAQYQPKYANLSLNNLNTLLNGTPGGMQNVTSSTKAGQSGWYDASGKFVSPGTLQQPAAPAASDNSGRQSLFDYLQQNMPGGTKPGQAYYVAGNAPSPGAVWRNSGDQFDVTQQQQVSGTPGLIEQYTQNLMPAEAAAQSAATSAQRVTDIRDVSTLGPQAQAAQAAANPGAAGLVNTLTTQAQAGLDAGSQLTADQSNQVNNSVNAAQASRGMAYGPAAAYGNVLANSEAGQQMQQQRKQQATNAVALNQQFYGDPFQAILGRPSGAQAGSQSLLSTGNQMQPGSQFNPESPYAQSMYSSYNQELANYNQANSPLAMFGNVMSGIGSLGTAAGGFAKLCWVAREVYGTADNRWTLFRRWLIRKSPTWFLLAYVKHGASVAEWVHNKPLVKAIIRVWMDARIASLNLQEA